MARRELAESDEARAWIGEAMLRHGMDRQRCDSKRDGIEVLSCARLGWGKAKVAW